MGRQIESDPLRGDPDVSVPDFNDVLKQTARNYLELLRSRGLLEEDSFRRTADKLRLLDVAPFLHAREANGNTGDPGVTQLLGVLLAIVTSGYQPLLVSDFDRTLTPFAEELAKAIGHIIEQGGTIGILTGNVKGAIDKHCFATQHFKQILSERSDWLERLHLFPKIATEHWAYDRKRRDYVLIRTSKLAEEVAKLDADGNILPQERWNLELGQRRVEQYRRILEEMITVFGLRDGFPGHPVAGRLVVDLGSQIDVRVPGEDSSEETRNAFVEYEERDYLKRTVYLRELYAAYVNLRTGQFDEGSEKGKLIFSKLREYLDTRGLPMPKSPKGDSKIPMKVRRAGRTNLEGALVGMDKAWGLANIASHFNQPPWTVVFSGDEFDEGGNDWPTLAMPNVLLNVGGDIRPSLEHLFFITSNVTGPLGLVRYYTLIGDVLKLMH